MTLAAARYGKDLVRVLRVVRNQANENGVIVHDVVEYNVRALVEGNISSSFIIGDNSVVVATDSIKNIIYYLAKTSPHVLSPELFATHIGVFLLHKYGHLYKAFVDVEMLRWRRIVVGEHGVEEAKSSCNKEDREAGHRHSFQRDGQDKRIAKVESLKNDSSIIDVRVTAGLSDLLLLKSSGSGFTNFIRDEFTTLVEVKDRILSTAVDLQYEFPKYTLRNGLESIGALETELQFEKAAQLARDTTIDLFATHDSESVQATLFKMGEAVIAGHEMVEKISYVLPNKHYIPVNMDYLGIANMTEDVAEVFMPVSAPSIHMAGDHKCPVCSSTFTRPQHVARHMRSHTGDRPYECTHCGDRFARSDLLSRHVNKCHASEKPPTTTQPARRKGHAQPGSSAAAGVSGPAPPLIPPPGTRKVCDACASSRTPAQCDARLPCGKCLQRSTKCSYIKALETIRRPQALQGVSLSKPTDLIAPPITVPSMGLPQRNDPTLFPTHTNFNFSVPLHANLSTQAASSQSPYFASNAGNQGSTPQSTQARGQLPVPAPYPAFMPDHHQQQQAPSTMFYPAPHTATRAKNELDAYLLENAFGGSNSIEGAETSSSSPYLYNNTHAQEFMAQSQHQPGLPHIDHHHIGYPGYTPPSTARPVSSHSSQHSHSTQPSPQQRHQSVYTNTSDTQAGNDSPSYASSSSASIQNNNALPPPSQTQPSDGGVSVSSAFGKMSIDDPIIAAEMNKSSSFFAPQVFPKTPNDLANSTISTSGTGLTPFLGPSYKWFSPSLNSSAGLLTPGLGLGSTLGLGNLSNTAYNLQASGSGLTPFLGPDALNGHVNFDLNASASGTVYTPGRESNIAELKEFWKQFMKTPGEKTPGVGTFGHGLHGDGSHTDTETSRPRHSLVKMASYPDLKTPGGSNNTQMIGPGVHGFDREDLRSYEQAVLARKAPQLTLIPKRRGTLPQIHGDMRAKLGIGSNDSDTLKPNTSFQQGVASSPSPSGSSSNSVSDPGSLATRTQKALRDRPTFKRLASQTLGPFESKSVKISHRSMNTSEVGAEEIDGDDDPEWSNTHDSAISANTFQHLRQQPQPCGGRINGQTTHDPTQRLNVSEAIAQG